ncbi:MAG: HAMP domain-containing sensor histidine kinase [Thermodesulfobacteriota bacterium]
MAIKHIQTSHLVHDLKNPVNIIEAGARSLLEKQDRYGALNPRQEKVIRRLLRNALKIRTLTNSMLEVDMAAMGMVKTRDFVLGAVVKSALMEVFDVVDPMVTEAIEEAHDFASLRRVLRDNDVILEAEDSHLNRTVRTDETKLGLIITNLLSNALKFKQKTILLRCATDGATVCVSVKDDGPGIPECYHQQIFDQYFQCGQIEGFPVRGHGLGLAGAQALTEALGGQLTLGCDSRGGAEFIVRIVCSK